MSHKGFNGLTAPRVSPVPTRLGSTLTAHPPRNCWAAPGFRKISSCTSSFPTKPFQLIVPAVLRPLHRSTLTYCGGFCEALPFRSLPISLPSRSAMAFNARVAIGQSSPGQLAPVLSEEIQAPAVSVFQIKQYLLKKAAKPPAPASAEQWTAESKRLREHLLKDVVFHGWPQEWVNAPARFEETGTLAGKGYRMRKLRYEIVPGFYGAAILYEPENSKEKCQGLSTSTVTSDLRERPLSTNRSAASSSRGRAC